MTYKPGRTSKIIDEEIRRQKAVEADYKRKQKKKAEKKENKRDGVQH